MKVKTGAVETVLVTTGEIFEHLAHLEFGKLMKALFSFKHRQIELKEGELTAPGNEVAYVFKAGETFGRKYFLFTPPRQIVIYPQLL